MRAQSSSRVPRARRYAPDEQPDLWSTQTGEQGSGTGGFRVPSQRARSGSPAVAGLDDLDDLIDPLTLRQDHGRHGADEETTPSWPGPAHSGTFATFRGATSDTGQIPRASRHSGEATGRRSAQGPPHWSAPVSDDTGPTGRWRVGPAADRTDAHEVGPPPTDHSGAWRTGSAATDRTGSWGSPTGAWQAEQPGSTGGHPKTNGVEHDTGRVNGYGTAASPNGYGTAASPNGYGAASGGVNGHGTANGYGTASGGVNGYGTAAGTNGYGPAAGTNGYGSNGFGSSLGHPATGGYPSPNGSAPTGGYPTVNGRSAPSAPARESTGPVGEQQIFSQPWSAPPADAWAGPASGPPLGTPVPRPGGRPVNGHANGRAAPGINGFGPSAAFGAVGGPGWAGGAGVGYVGAGLQQPAAPTAGPRPEPRQKLEVRQAVGRPMSAPPAEAEVEVEDSEAEADGTYRGAAIAALVWCALPMALFIGWALFLARGPSSGCVDNNGQPCAGPDVVAWQDLPYAAPVVAAAAALSVLVALTLRRFTTGWRSSTVGFAAAVVGAGVVTVFWTAFGR